MNAETAAKICDYLNSIKTQNKDVKVCVIRDIDLQNLYGLWGVRIIAYDNEEPTDICEYYKATHDAFKSMRSEVRTNWN